MAKNRMTFEKTQREMKKRRKAEEKRALRKKRKEQEPMESELPTVPEPVDEELSER